MLRCKSVTRSTMHQADDIGQQPEAAEIVIPVAAPPTAGRAVDEADSGELADLSTADVLLLLQRTCSEFAPFFRLPVQDAAMVC